MAAGTASLRAPVSPAVQRGFSLRVTFTGAAHLDLQSREIALFLSSLSCQVEEAAKAFGMRDADFCPKV